MSAKLYFSLVGFFFEKLVVFVDDFRRELTLPFLEGFRNMQ